MKTGVRLFLASDGTTIFGKIKEEILNLQQTYENNVRQTESTNRGKLQSETPQSDRSRKQRTSQISQSIPQREFRTQDEGNRRMAQAESAIRRGKSDRNNETQLSGSESAISGLEKEQREAEAYAKANGIWIPYTELSELGYPSLSGNENENYTEEDGYIYKVNNLQNSGGILSLFNRINLHNEIFPETSYTFIGFTGFDGRSVYPIFRQKYVGSSKNATPEEINEYMTLLGYIKKGDTQYIQGDIIISDLRPRNVLKDDDGNIYVIDAEVRRNSDSKLTEIYESEQNPEDPDVGNDLSPDDAGNRGADTGGRGTEQGTERVIPTADTAQTAATGQTPETPAESSNLSIHESQQKQTGIPYRLSNELDENGCPFVLASDGTTIFGEINEETGLIPAPIKLSEGTKDYGLLHIESRHGQQIKQSGFKGVIEFVENVAQNYTDIKEGKVRNSNKTYIIEVSDKYNNTLFVELSQDGSYWNVNSAGVFRKRYSQEKKTVWSASEVQNQQSVADDTLRAQGNPDTNIAPNGTVPQMVDAKDSKESPDIQEADNKNSNLPENEVRNATSPSGEDSNLSDTEERYRESEEPVSPETLAKDRAELEEIFGKSFFPNVFETVKKRTAERMAALTIWKIKSPILTDANHTKTTHISDLNRTFNIKDSK